MIWAWTVALFGTLLVGVGGLVATYGWDLRSDELQRRAMLRAVAAETQVNLAILKDPKYSESDADRLRELVVYPKLQTTSVEGALASGQFVVAERDREFLARLTDARQLAADFNQRLIFMEAQMAALSPDDVARYRQTIRDGKTRASVVSIESGLAEHLISKYGVRKDDVFFAKYQ